MSSTLAPRIIPCLLIENGRLVKTVRFANPTYLGDPINAVRIFSAYEVDELFVLDIGATRRGGGPPIEFIERMASECFIPMCYGGGITGIAQIRRIVSAGIEKVSIGSAAVSDPQLIAEASGRFGSQCIVVCVDVIRASDGAYEVVTHNATQRTGLDPLDHGVRMVELGAGELIINSVDRDGSMNGYDIELIRRIAPNVDVPVTACGGAGALADMARVLEEGEASAAAAGSLFVFYGKHRGVLINYPERAELEALVP